ncbi:MAG: VIT1/CCC1 transporter family protein, partial [Candidatus Dormibacteraceae bacterium]
MSEVTDRLLQAWRGEIEARYVYEILARRESDPRRADVLRRIAEAEGTHRKLLENRLTALGVPIPDESSVQISPWLKLQARLAPTERLLRAREAAESDEVLGVYGQATHDSETDALLHRIQRDEKSHARAVDEMILNAAGGEGADAPAGHRLQRILGRETWHRTSHGWISDAIYGANDGLAAVFGIVAGVSGATDASSFVLTAGLAGAVASALSMGVGAWLAARSTTEMAAANLAQEQRELAEHPEEEKEE